MHRDRPGSEFENVDVIAVHWRSDEVAEIVTVEVKLDFTARAVQQASNYRRFSDRVWLAVPVTAKLTLAANELRETDPLLFDHVVDVGLGILACRKSRGAAMKSAQSSGRDWFSQIGWNGLRLWNDTARSLRKLA